MQGRQIRDDVYTIWGVVSGDSCYSCCFLDQSFIFAPLPQPIPGTAKRMLVFSGYPLNQLLQLKGHIGRRSPEVHQDMAEKGRLCTHMHHTCIGSRMLVGLAMDITCHTSLQNTFKLVC